MKDEEPEPTEAESLAEIAKEVEKGDDDPWSELQGELEDPVEEVETEKKPKRKGRKNKKASL